MTSPYNPPTHKMNRRCWAGALYSLMIKKLWNDSRITHVSPGQLTICIRPIFDGQIRDDRADRAGQKESKENTCFGFNYESLEVIVVEDIRRAHQILFNLMPASRSVRYLLYKCGQKTLPRDGEIYNFLYSAPVYLIDIRSQKYQKQNPRFSIWTIYKLVLYD